MNRVFYFLLALGSVLVLILLYVFYEHSENNPTSRVHNDTVLTLKLAHNTPVDSALNEASILFAKEIAKKSNGKIKIEVYPSQQLGNDHKMLELAREGQIDILLMPTAKMSISIPSMQYADLPFFFPTKQDLYNMLDGEPGKILLNKLKSIDLVGVTFWENGFKHFSANSAITKPDDFIGKKIRIMKSRIIKEQFEDFGAKPVVIDFYSTKKALADGVVDGQENPLVAFYSMGFYKVQTHLTLSEHAYLGYVVSISARTFNKLSHEERKLLIETAKEITPWERAKTKDKEAELLKKIKDYGVTVDKLTPDEKEQFKSKTESIVNKYENIIGSDIISKTQELLLDKYPQKNILTIGLDVDLSADEYNAGLAIKRGAQLAIDEINKNGGILGKKLVLITKNNQVLPSKGIANVKELLKRNDLVAIIGGKNGNVVKEEVPIVQKNKVPFLIPWASVYSLTKSTNGNNNFVFRVSADNEFASTFIIEQALKKYKRLAIIAENTSYGNGNVNNMRKYLEDKHLPDFVDTLIFNRGQTNFKRELAQLSKSNVDCVILIANSLEGSIIVRTLYDNNPNIAILSHWGIVGGDFFKNNDDVLKKLNMKIFKTFSFDHNKNNISKALEKNYKQSFFKFGDNKIVASYAVAQTYDLVMMLAQAIKNANSTNGLEIKNELEKLNNFHGAIKTYKQVFTKANHDALDLNDYFMEDIKRELGNNHAE